MNSVVYWIHSPFHTELTQGYIGISQTFGKRNGRNWRHFNQLKHGSHKNPILQNAYNKAKGKLRISIVYTGKLHECLNLEYLLRPVGLGWNILPGGNLPPSQKGKKWYTNGIKNIKSVECPDGYSKGKMQVSGPLHKGYGKSKSLEHRQKIACSLLGNSNKKGKFK